MSAGDTIELAPQHDLVAYAATYAATGRVHVPKLLREEDARRLHDALARRTPWELVVIHNGPRQMTLAQWEAIPPGQKQAMQASFAEGARTPGRFQARFLTAHLSLDGEPFTGPVPELQALSRFLNSEPFLAFARAVTGDDAIRLADAHASYYRPGDFLHRHHDHIDDVRTHRVAAYILNLTPVWCAEWGGLLAFLRPDGHVSEAYTPAWNAINFLKVPQGHFVSEVASFVTAPRLAVTGWVRRR